MVKSDPIPATAFSRVDHGPAQFTTTGASRRSLPFSVTPATRSEVCRTSVTACLNRNRTPCRTAASARFWAASIGSSTKPASALNSAPSSPSASAQNASSSIRFGGQCRPGSIAGTRSRSTAASHSSYGTPTWSNNEIVRSREKIGASSITMPVRRSDASPDPVAVRRWSAHSDQQCIDSQAAATPSKVE